MVLKNSAKREMRRLPPDVLRRVADNINKIQEDPCVFEFLAGSEMTRKSRVGGYRILFNVYMDSREVKILAIGLRGSVYK